MTSYKKLKIKNKRLLGDIYKLLYGDYTGKSLTEMYYKWLFEQEKQVMYGNSKVKQQTI